MTVYLVEGDRVYYLIVEPSRAGWASFSTWKPGSMRMIHFQWRISKTLEDIITTAYSHYRDEDWQQLCDALQDGLPPVVWDIAKALLSK